MQFAHYALILYLAKSYMLHPNQHCCSCGDHLHQYYNKKVGMIQYWKKLTMMRNKLIKHERICGTTKADTCFSKNLHDICFISTFCYILVYLKSKLVVGCLSTCIETLVFLVFSIHRLVHSDPLSVN